MTKIASRRGGGGPALITQSVLLSSDIDISNGRKTFLKLQNQTTATSTIDVIDGVILQAKRKKCLSWCMHIKEPRRLSHGGAPPAHTDINKNSYHNKIEPLFLFFVSLLTGGRDNEQWILL